MNLNWDDMRFFLALCRTQSFVSAAIDLKVTHSTVARRISALENSLATQLFHRTEKGCRLTPAGEMLLPHAEQLESTVINLTESVAGKNNQLSGSIRIGAPDGLGNCFLASCLTELQTLQPILEVELIAVPMYYSLSKREIDILITVRKPTTGNIVARKLTNYRLGLFATSGYLANQSRIRNREDLRGHRFIGYIGDLLYDQDLEFLEEVSPGLKAHFRSSTVIAQLNAVLEGAGIGVIPYFMAYGHPALVPILPEHYLERSFWLQVNPDSRQLARVRTTIDFIAANIEKSRDRFLFLPEY
ncbi:LysR family transcriptional regulator [Desulfopila aestuarii]|uniref:DNA-binding transcriptional regulator, LysR family n=1 Tax=Desulfopila aestuarii DSM 18488 TaxID=1121416 RepID=A0A1M7YAM1_9BACT|nr:LysR family transcriptional regulator [Desulfopila aestuarii]SHO49685.1 DNA-binding transcriptional regulator, LysR family [Desulfopila aestuarii DSM 18488]